jgi:hypothetical protein
MVTIRREFVVERHEVTGVVIYEVTGEDLEQLEKETLTVGEDFSGIYRHHSTQISGDLCRAPDLRRCQEPRTHGMDLNQT